MATLRIPTAEIAGGLETDLEGRLEVMRDDDNQDTPDYIDCDAVASALREIKAFPAIIPLSDAEAVQAHIAVCNCIEFDDENDYSETLAHLTAQGYGSKE